MGVGAGEGGRVFRVAFRDKPETQTQKKGGKKMGGEGL